MKTLIRFIVRYYFVIMFIILEGLSLWMFSRNNYYQGSKMARFANENAGGIYNAYNSMTDYFNLRKNNIWLAEENARLREQIEESYLSFVDTVFRMQDTVYKQQYLYLDSKIVSNSTSKRNNYLMLNKGSEDGVQAGMAVISSEGVVGVVKVVSKHFSSVMSILHSESNLSAKIKRGGYAGSVIWEGKDYKRGSLIDIPSNFQVEIGDTVVTSGYSLDFPEGVPVGVVSDIKTRPGSNFHSLEINFSVDYKRLDYAYVVKNLFKSEQEELQYLQSIDE